MRVGILTVSDRSARGERIDEGGPLAERIIAGRGGDVVARAVVPDERERIEEVLRGWSDAGRADLIVTTGGTGLGPRDVTPEAVRSVIDREAPGIAEAIRGAGLARTPFAALSRQVAGLRGRTLIVALPGSPRAVREGLEAIADVLPHAVGAARGSDDHEGSPNRRSSRGASPAGGPRIVTGLQRGRLEVDGLARKVHRPDCGALVVFEGTARSPSGRRRVRHLVYEAHDGKAPGQLRAIAEDVAVTFGLGGALLVHRLGRVEIGEPAVVAAASAPHRDAAFAAARALIDRAKTEAFIWKKEVYADPGVPGAWVGLPGSGERVGG